MAEAGPEVEAADFSYREKDLLPAVGRGLNEALKNLQLVNTGRERASLHFVRVYGEAFESKQRKPKHNGRETSGKIFSLQLELMWYGRVMLGETTLGSAQGKVKVPQLDMDNFDKPDEWEMEVKLDIESIPGMPQQPEQQQQQQGFQQVRLDASEVQLRLKNLVKEEGLWAIRPALSAAVARLLGPENTSLSEEPVHDAKEGPPAPESAQDGGTAVDCEDLRRQLLGKAYHKVVDEGPSDCTKLVLRLCTIHDRDMAKLCKVLAKSSALESLDLYFNYIGDQGAAELAEAIKGLPALRELNLQNNRIGDEGVQSLMTMLALHGAPALRELNLEDNAGISAVGRTIASGLSALRKDLRVRFSQ